MFPFLMIFVLIAGAIILIFFFQFSEQFKSSGEAVNKATILRNIDQNLAAFSLPNNAFNPKIDLGLKSEIEVGCFNKQTNLTFQDKILKSQKMIVSPAILKGKTIQAWTLSWDYPFKVGNFYYLIPGKGEPRGVSIFIKTLPTDINRERKKFIDDFKFFKFTPTDRTSFNNAPSTDKKIAIILDSTLPNGYGINTKVVRIDFDQDLIPREVEVFRGSDPEYSTPYLGNAMALAVIFSSSEDNYNCIRDQAIERLKDIISIYKKKIDLLRTKLDSSCTNSINGVLVRLTTMENSLSNPNTMNLDIAKQLEEGNKGLRKINCPELYLQ